MKHLPAFIESKGKNILVVGGCAMAARRVAMVQRAQAKVKVVSKNLSAEFEDLEKFDYISRDFLPADLEDVTLVFVADDNKVLEAQVSLEAKRRGILVNVADQQELSSFIVPSIIDRSPMMVAVSSGGEAPILSRMLRAKLETLVPAGYGRLAEFARSYRHRVTKLIKDSVRRRRFWEEYSSGTVAELVLSGQIDDSKKMMELALKVEEKKLSAPPQGEVYLVGSGPGDPDLLTFRAFRLMQKADIVLHDRLVSKEILDLVRRDADSLFVGKKSGDHAIPQEEISRLLVDFAKKGKRVLRLKGGDPFTFGRGGEEIEVLASKGIPFQVVPGISAANGCAAYAGIPLTHRDHAQSCTFVTGHTKDGKLDLSWSTLIEADQTVVVYMGLNSLPEFLKSYVGHGGKADMPVAVIDKGTRMGQRVVSGNIGNLTAEVERAELDGPAIIIIGTVVTLRDTLSWFEGSPEKQFQ